MKKPRAKRLALNRHQRRTLESILAKQQELEREKQAFLIGVLSAIASQEEVARSKLGYENGVITMTKDE